MNDEAKPECVCGHDEKSHTQRSGEWKRCVCCVTTMEQDDHRGRRALVVFRYIKGRAGHFSGPVKLF